MAKSGALHFLRRYLQSKPLLPAKPGLEMWSFLVGVFFTFTLVGTVSSMTWVRATPDAPWLVLSAIVGGLYAVGYAAALTYRWWWLLAATIALQAFVVPRLVWPWLASEGIIQASGVIGEDNRATNAAIEKAVSVRQLGFALAVIGLALGQIFITMFVRRLADRTARERAELAVAKRLHATLVPDVDTQTALARVVGRSNASSELGGDLLDAVRCDESVEVVVADVSGHGVKAGVGMALVKGAIRMSLRGDQTRDLAQMTSDLNGVLAASLEPGMFVTMACVRVERSRALVAMAGHLPIFWWRAQLGVVERIENEALPLGVQDDAQFTQREVAVAPGDLLVLMTDGLMETANVSGRQLGLATLEAVVAREAKAGAMAIVDGIFNASDTHGKPTDDRTVAVIEIR